MNSEYSLIYPRRRFIRFFMTRVTRLLLRVFARMRVTGQENIPASGPVILVGNHIATIEVALMCSYSRRQVEMIGLGDIPLDPAYAPILKGYGYIPINRGTMDRPAMNNALDVLKQDGVIGIFPEGGIWETTMSQARTGVSWLSSKSNAPIVPIGFGGMRQAVRDIFRLKRPALVMNIGEPLPAISMDVPGKTRKQALADGAEEIMRHVTELIPEAEKASWALVASERFTLEVDVRDATGATVPIPEGLQLDADVALSKLFHRPVIIRTWARNLRMPVNALRQLDKSLDLNGVIDAVDAVDVFVDENPHFLSYRFGVDEAQQMHQGLQQLRELARWSVEHGYTVRLSPLRHYRPDATDEEIVETVVEIA